MADIEIAVKAKNEASAAISAVSKDLQGLSQSVATTSQSFANVGEIGKTFAGASAEIRQISTSLQQAAADAAGYNRTLSDAAKVQNAGGVEAISEGIKRVRAELTATLKEADKLAGAGKLNFGEGTDANLAKIRNAVSQTRAELNNLQTAGKAAAQAGVLGDGAAASRGLATVEGTAKQLREGLRSVGNQAKQTAQDVAQIGKNTSLGNVKQQVVDLDRSLGNIGGVFAGGLGGIAGLVGIGATAAAIGQVVGNLEQAVQAADKVGKLRASFDQLTAAAGQSGDKILNALRGASGGMITDADLLLSANKAMMLGVADSAEEMTALLDVARARGQAMGLSVSEAFDNIVTGLGRGSALILDNLGIVVDAATANEEYARSIGKVASQLSEQEKKQALVNAVMQQSKGLTTAAPTGPGAAAAQANVARQNAQVVTGDFFAPVFREYYDAQTDFINQGIGRWNEYATRVRDINQIAADFAGDNRNDPEQVRRFADLAQAMNVVQQAMAAGVDGGDRYADVLAKIATQAQFTRNIDANTAAEVQLAANATKQIAEAYAQRRAALDALDPKLENNRQKTQDVATAEEIAAAQATLAKYSVDALGSSFVTAAAQAGYLVAGLSQIQAQAGATAGIIYNLADAQSRLKNVSNANLAAPDALDRVLPQINNLGQTLVSNGMTPAQAIAAVKDMKTESADIVRTMEAQGASQEEIYLTLYGNVQQTQAWASNLDKVSASAQEAKRQFDDIQSKVAGLIQQSTQLPTFKASDLFDAKQLEQLGLTGDSQVSVDQAANGGKPLDAINENAKRLMAIAKEGFTNQPWLEEFKKEVPAVFAELQNSPDIRGAALGILKQFEDGLRPELLDQGMIKDRVKKMIIGDQNAAALANEIAQEIAQEMGISVPQAMQATQAALGITPADGAGTANAAAPDMTPQGQAAGKTLRDGMVSGFDASGMTVEILAKVDAEFGSPKSWLAINKSGATVGAVWGGGFLAGASGNIPPGLYDILLNGLVPLMVAALAGNGSRTGAQP